MSLAPGQTIELKVDERLKQGVTVGWSGTACENQPEKSSQRFNCRVLEAATMTVTNTAAASGIQPRSPTSPKAIAPASTVAPSSSVGPT